MTSVRAVYRNGQFQLLDSVDLQEGQEVQLQIVKQQTPVQALIGDMLTHFERDETEIDEDAVLLEVEQSLKGNRPLSEIIIEERADNPNNYP